MSDISPELSKKNKYHISKHRYYELKHYCLQYKEWKKAYRILEDSIDSRSRSLVKASKDISNSNPTETLAIALNDISKHIKLVESTAVDTDKELGSYIFTAVTEGFSYTYMREIKKMPCCR